jgi:hypothetical protein
MLGKLRIQYPGATYHLDEPSRMNRKPGRKLSVLRDQLLALNGGPR